MAENTSNQSMAGKLRENLSAREQKQQGQQSRFQKKAPATTYRISKTTGAMMMTLAIICDILSIIPIVDDIVAILYLLIFFVWFSIKGVPYFSSSNFKTQIAVAIVEFIPLVSILPGISYSVFKRIATSRVEDKLNSSKLAGLAINKIGNTKT